MHRFLVTFKCTQVTPVIFTVDFTRDRCVSSARNLQLIGQYFHRTGDSTKSAAILKTHSSCTFGEGIITALYLPSSLSCDNNHNLSNSCNESTSILHCFCFDYCLFGENSEICHSARLAVSKLPSTQQANVPRRKQAGLFFPPR